jgi:hypothetical protein
MSIKLLALALLLSGAALPAKAAGLTVKTGETWVFSLSGGQPVKARKVSANAKPAAGQIVVTVRSMMGTTMTITSNNKRAYTYKAELIGGENRCPPVPAPCLQTTACRSRIGRRRPRPSVSATSRSRPRMAPAPDPHHSRESGNPAY